MSIQIYEDSSNVQGHGKKTKRGDDYPMKTNSNIPKPTKRVALGNITNQVQGSRIQPTRAAKEKHKVLFDTFYFFVLRVVKCYQIKSIRAVTKLV